MEFQITTDKLDSLQADLGLLPVYQDGKPSRAMAGLSGSVRSRISQAMACGDIRGKPGETLLLTDTGRLGVKRLLLTGLGRKDKLDARAWRKAAAAAVASRRALGGRARGGPAGAGGSARLSTKPARRVSSPSNGITPHTATRPRARRRRMPGPRTRTAG